MVLFPAMKYLILIVVTFCMRIAGLPHIEHREKPLTVVNVTDPHVVAEYKALKQLPDIRQ